jgi:neutral ceramidase
MARLQSLLPKNATVGQTTNPRARPVKWIAIDSMKTSLSLRAGFAGGDVTPPLQVGLLLSSVEGKWQPFESVRQRLLVKVAALESGSVRVALVSLDLLGLADEVVGGWKSFKQRVADKAGKVVSAENIIITSTHTHCAPESLGLTDLYQRKEFQSWLEQVGSQIGTTIRAAFEKLEDCTCSFGVTSVPGFTVYRRIKTKNGIQLSHLFNVTRPEFFDGKPMDERLKVLSFRRTKGNRIMGLVAHAVCHPVYEMCLPHVSGDFAGEFCQIASAQLEGAPVLFLNGAAGNINPRKLAGPSLAKFYADTLWEKTAQLIASAASAEEGSLRIMSHALELPSRSPEGKSVTRLLSAPISALSVGSVGFLFLPGEPFVETGLSIEGLSPFENTVVVGYSENWIGYIPTNRAFEEGGYETGPGKWARLQTGAEPLIAGTSAELLRQLYRRSAVGKPDSQYADAV